MLQQAQAILLRRLSRAGADAAASSYGARAAARALSTVADTGVHTHDFRAAPSHGTDPEELALTSAAFTVKDSPGALRAALDLFERFDINMTHLESRPAAKPGYWSFDVALMGTENDSQVQGALEELKRMCTDVKLPPPKRVPWFPRRIEDLDTVSQKTLDAGSDLESDHPGFNDQAYRKRRDTIVQQALTYQHGEPLPHVAYNEEEVKTWGTVYRKLKEFFPKYACRQFLDIIADAEKQGVYGEHQIPQLQAVSDYLHPRTGFTLRPVGGLLSGRDFLNALAFRVFFSTQYIRHHSVPLYTPEPDVCHELMGHAPMFADPDFADFSHEIGLASLGASDADIARLAALYWFGIEFSLCEEGGQKKAVGAGLLSSFGELEYACSATRPAGGTDKWPEYMPFDPWRAADSEFPITTYQPKYFVAESLSDLKVQVRQFCRSLPRPFHARSTDDYEGILVDRAVAPFLTAEQQSNMATSARTAASAAATE